MHCILIVFEHLMNIDIRGANNIGWKSVLLRSGVYDGIMNSENPTTIQDNVSNAIDWIFKEHNI